MEAAEADIVDRSSVKPVQVTIYAFRIDDEILFDHRWKRQGDSGNKKGKVIIPAEEADVPIHFQLRDESGAHLQFLDDWQDAIWVALDGCPTGTGNGGQIKDGESNRNLLKVVDANSGSACTLYYSLWFSGDEVGGQSRFEYDPEIRNGGGGQFH
ncbi:hypothetical protein [Sphingomonas xanthus]|uniref:Uncharacterized protein n=1 Tax=Sphingomonas xanthus TaxID=2594473 RepID=A0A516IS27_9SPHN|nr:hypothetical protein [Sphingomonas xanthus]QDP19634.1 hypothetical protein FMM02_06455 [Sphingomonas xanthus]